MKKMIVFVLLSVSVYSQEYYSKVKALNSYVIKAAVSGKITFSNDALEGKFANNSLIIQIDNSLDLIDLKESKNKMLFLNEMISIEKKNYSRLIKVSSKSIFEKESQKLKYINLQSNKADLNIKIFSLEDKIKNKKLYEKNNYIFNISVKNGDYVNPGNILYESKDLSAGKLEIFIPILDAQSILKQDIYINDVKSDLKISKIFKVADEKHISSYKAIIIMPKVDLFSKLVKIEFK